MQRIRIADPKDDKRPMTMPFIPGLEMAMLENSEQSNLEVVCHFFNLGMRTASGMAAAAGQQAFARPPEIAPNQAQI